MSAFPHHYTLYGLTVSSNRPIAGLLPAGPEQTSNAITVDFAGEIQPRPATPPFMKGGFETLWHLDDQRWLVEYSAPEKSYVWTALHEPGSIVVRWNDDAILDDIAPILQGSAISATLHLRGIPLLHASILAVGDFAIAVMGAPGAGKSTTAAAFVAAGYALVSDDIGALDLTGPGVQVHSGYPRMRLYSDSANAAGLDVDALQKVFRDDLLDDKFFIELPQTSFRSGRLPLRAIYILQPRAGDAHEPAIGGFDGLAAVPELMKNLYSLRFLDRGRFEKALENCMRIAIAVPVRTVQAAHDLSKLRLLVQSIAADAHIASIDVRESQT